MNELLKDMYFTRIFFDKLCTEITKVFPDFDRAAFEKALFTDIWEDQALKEKMRSGTLALGQTLPKDYLTALDILVKVEPNMLDFGFDLMIFSDYTAMFGLDHWDESIRAIEQFTKNMSAEYAIRYFINEHFERTMQKMLVWAQHSHEQVRRLASEGCRPHLPWGIGVPALVKNPDPIIPILETLKNDPAETVRKSVANNLNDLSRDHPEVLVGILSKWKAENLPEIDFYLHQGLRTLIKKGNPDALQLMGFNPQPEISLEEFSLGSDEVHIGEKLPFEFTIRSLSDQSRNLMIDYVVHLVRKNNKTSQKVFKLTKKELAPGESLKISRKHDFAVVTTRNYYPGIHSIEIQINGKRFSKLDFSLLPAEQH